ncbi:hypothetical protein K491DRAFT_717491 [Lophiostoma macrostomum CBS 122681]|uniref:HMG box domain-containing protein n=1 Tax=Lophiostoma macrostomum CBS 122681 TaxID=1314788 RepID=A0A6A6T5A3_9PLEO|nr:hypothetical protein K491DRAFT_717491 [Lophiostoma macrostomum CBS 122681]
MLANRIVLPPIVPRSPFPPPVATFYHIPRRYVKSNMQVGSDASGSRMEDVRPSHYLRKSNRISDLRPGGMPTPTLQTRGLRGSPPTSAPSSPQVIGKRTAPVDDELNGGESARAESPAGSKPPGSASSTGSGELSGHVCLCQPEPKIPRPRNAFILYRQHHQQAIVAHNPGLANPEISKIIGEQWKAESEEQKKVWTDLALEEKARHQEQYPEYRYQPRRLGRPGSSPLNPSGQHTTVDKYRCPKCGGRSIKTPTSPFSAATTPVLPSPSPSVNHTPTSRYLPAMSNLSLDSPGFRRRGPGPSNLSNIQVPSSAHRDAPMYSPQTPDSKRRRFNNYSSSSNGRRSEAPYYTHAARRESLPPISTVRTSPPGTATMPPPPRTPRDLRRGSVDLNVLVPNQHDQSRSVEAMVMSVPYQVKIKVLGRITPPYKEPGPTSPAVPIRGAIIAVEGEDKAVVKGLAEWLQEYLAKDNAYGPRIADAPKTPDADSKDVTFEDYLDLIKEWHGKSQEMKKFITTPISSSDSESDKDKQSAPLTPEPVKKPVLILPTYQLHASDAYTSRIPIQDAYSPTDHWQWMATLWRGTVGPDLTIYIKNSGESKEDSPSGKLVDINEEARLLTVRKEKGADVEAGALRRVGFEVDEWIRSIGTRGN